MLKITMKNIVINKISQKPQKIRMKGSEDLGGVREKKTCILIYIYTRK